MDAYINKIVAQQPNSVAQLFSIYGYDMPVNSRNLTNLVKVYGSQKLPFSNVNGDEKANTTLSDIIDAVSKGATSIAKVITAVKGSTSVSDGVSVSLEKKPIQPVNRILGVDKNIFLMLTLVVVILIAVLIFRKEK